MFLAIGSAAQAQTNISAIEPGKLIESEEVSIPKLQTQPRSYQFPDNSQVDVSKFALNRKKVELRKLNDGLKYKSIVLVSYQDYIEDRKKRGLDVLENLQVHPNRQVFLVEIDAPNGVELPNRGDIINKQRREIGADGQDIIKPIKPPKPIKLKKAKILLVLDAETGEQFDADIFGVNDL